MTSTATDSDPALEVAVQTDVSLPSLWHGGFPGLRVGDVLTGGHHREALDDCPTCRARLAQYAGGPRAVADPASDRPEEVYLTTERWYAKLYASLYGRGDLYRVEPLGALSPSAEDEGVPCWTVPSARVVAVYDRAVLLTRSERRANTRRIAPGNSWQDLMWRRRTLADIDRLPADRRR